MSWTTAIQDVREQLGDNPTTKLRYRKRCIGQINGSNTAFKTFEFRRITDFTEAEPPLGVYVDGELAGIGDDNPEVGEFNLSEPPSDGQVVEATYYIQYFIETEIEGYLRQASVWLGNSTDYSTLPPGLWPAAKFYACKQGCEALALRWAERMSEVYLMEDAPRSDQRSPVDDFRKLAADYYKQATDAQANYYTRQGQNLQPLFASIPGAARNITPKS